ncbi:MAG: FAD:protein FMN transferase [Ruminococcus sp.]
MWKDNWQNPFHLHLGILEICDQAVITSGGYERYFEQDGKTYHHIMDPATGRPAESGLTSVTIVSEDGTLADALSTALFVMGSEKASDYWQKHSEQFDAVFLSDDRALYVTEGLKNAFSSDYTWNLIQKEN